MRNRLLAVAVLVVVLAFCTTSARAFETVFTPEIYLLAGAQYRSLEFDYHNAYVRYVRTHGTSAGFEDYYMADETETELFIDTAAFAVGATAGEHIFGKVGGIYEMSEGGEQDFQLDLAYVALAFGGFSLEVGRDYLDIAPFASQSVFHSWSRELAETRADALTAALDGFLFELWGSVFKGRYPVKPKRNEETIEDYAAGIELKPLAMREDMSLIIGASYLGDMCETKAGLGELVTASEPETVQILVDTTGDGNPDSWIEIEVGEQDNVYEKRSEMLSIYGEFDISLGTDLTAGGGIEYSFASRSFKKTDLTDSEGHEARPAAYNAELWVELYDALSIAARLQGAKDFYIFSTDANEAREVGPIVAFSLGDNFRTSLEYMYGTDSDRNTWHRAALGVELSLP